MKLVIKSLKTVAEIIGCGCAVWVAWGALWPMALAFTVLAVAALGIELYFTWRDAPPEDRGPRPPNLPPTSREVEAWDFSRFALGGKGGFGLLVGGITFVVGLIGVAALFVFGGAMVKAIPTQPIAQFVFLGALLGMIRVAVWGHELMHLLPMRLAGTKAYLSTRWRGEGNVVTTAREAFTRTNYVLVTLSPLAVAVFGGIGIWLSQSAEAWLMFVTFTYLAVFLPAADYVVAWRVSRYPSVTRFEDTGIGYRAFVVPATGE